MPVTGFHPAGRASVRGDAPAALFLIAVWFALLTGLAEVAGLAAAKLVLGRYLHLPPYVVWMAPVADLVVLGGAALVLWLLARSWPTLVSLRRAAFVFALLAALSLALMVTKLHGWAALLLAAGAAAQSSRLIAAHRDGFRSLVRRTTVGMAAVVVALAAVVHAGPRLAEWRSLAALAQASPGVPNVLLIVLDTVRAPSLSLYGYARPTTPQLERLAARGVVFQRAFSTSPWTLPSHASMFTGRYPHELSADWALER
jgi:glucan phosphoethanolaminetransferase (alkaline phosphatase superfamily)